jgi:hypothetical protein
MFKGSRIAVEEAFKVSVHCRRICKVVQGVERESSVPGVCVLIRDSASSPKHVSGARGLLCPEVAAVVVDLGDTLKSPSAGGWVWLRVESD